MSKETELYKDFKVERDPFCLEADVSEGLEDKWWILAEKLINEKPDERFLFWNLYSFILRIFFVEVEF